MVTLPSATLGKDSLYRVLGKQTFGKEFFKKKIFFLC
jgi:hypothetical protein